MGLFGRKPAAFARFEAAGRTVRCPHCDRTEFQLTRSWWDGPLNKGRHVDLLLCTACGRQIAFNQGAVNKVE